MLKMYIVIFVFACTAGIIIGRLSAKNSEKAKNEAVFYNMLNSFNRIYDAVIDYLLFCAKYITFFKLLQ